MPTQNQISNTQLAQGYGKDGMMMSPYITNPNVQLQQAPYMTQNPGVPVTQQKVEVKGVVGPMSWPIRIASVLWLIATVVFIFVYGTRRNAQVSDKYFLWVTPPGYFFSIWGVIFGLKIIVNLINLFKNVWTIREHITLAINNALLNLWIGIFTIGNDVAVYISFLILLSIIPVCWFFWRKVGQLLPIDWFTYVTRNSYAFYLGWIIAATHLNLGIIIRYWWLSGGMVQMIIFWVLAPLSAIIVTVINIALERLFGLKCCFALWISVAWAFAGAAITTNRCLVFGCYGP